MRLKMIFVTPRTIWFGCLQACVSTNRRENGNGNRFPFAAEANKEAFLPFSAPWFGDEEKNEILQTLDSDWITTGPRTKTFEAKFADYIGSGEAVAVNSCTAALHLALAAIGVSLETPYYQVR